MGGGLFFYTMSISNCVCLICQSNIAIPKKGNVERQFWTNPNPPKSELRNRKVYELKSQLSGQQSFFTQHTSKVKAATEASFRVSHIIVNNKKSFQDREMVKEAFVEAANSLFRDFKNKAEILSSIKALQPSRNRVTWRCEAMAEDVTQQMWKDIGDCECFSLQLDKSTDMSDTAQMCIFIRMVFSDITAKEELLLYFPWKNTREERTYFSRLKTLLRKLSSQDTNWCPSPRMEHPQWLATWMDLLPSASRMMLSQTSWITIA